MRPTTELHGGSADRPNRVKHGHSQSAPPLILLRQLRTSLIFSSHLMRWRGEFLAEDEPYAALPRSVRKACGWCLPSCPCAGRMVILPNFECQPSEIDGLLARFIRRFGPPIGAEPPMAERCPDQGRRVARIDPATLEATWSCRSNTFSSEPSNRSVPVEASIRRAVMRIRLPTSLPSLQERSGRPARARPASHRQPVPCE